MKNKLLKVTKVLILGVLAGIMIAIGGYVNLYCSLNFANNIAGGILFSFGLIAVCFFGLNLFTGKAAYIFENKRGYFLDLLIMMVGNFLGAALIGIIFAYSNNINEATLAGFIAKKIAFTENGISIVKLILMSMMAGALVYLAVEGFKKMENQVAKMIAIMLPISIMVIIGGEHSVANGFYFFASIFVIEANGWLVFATVMISIVFNIIGSLIVRAIFKSTLKIGDFEK